MVDSSERLWGNGAAGKSAAVAALEAIMRGQLRRCFLGSGRRIMEALQWYQLGGVLGGRVLEGGEAPFSRRGKQVVDFYWYCKRRPIPTSRSSATVARAIFDPRSVQWQAWSSRNGSFFR